LADLLGVRAANSLGRAELSGWSGLAAHSPLSLGEIPDVGPGTVEEVVSVAVREWAAAYLRSAESAPVGGHGVGRDLQSAGGRPEAGSRLVARAFEELEARPGFEVMRRRELDPGEAPTLTELAAERGVTTERIRNMHAATRKQITSETREDYRPIVIAAEAVRDRLGAVAWTEELDGAFEAIDPDGTALPAALSHRRALLLLLAEYRISGRWVLGPDIENLTRVVLAALSDESGSAGLDRVGRHLARLGIREDVQLPWIAHQIGFRIVDGEVQPAGSDPEYGSV
jgi:hypothetical protein